MLPPAPGLFSTTKGCPKTSCSLGAISRASTSLVLPVMGTMMRTGLVGIHSCAQADETAPIHKVVVSARAPICRRLKFFILSPVVR